MPDRADLLPGPSPTTVELAAGTAPDGADVVVRGVAAEDVPGLPPRSARLAALSGFAGAAGAWASGLAADGRTLEVLVGLGGRADLDVERLRSCAHVAAQRALAGISGTDRGPADGLVVDVDLAADTGLGHDVAVQAVAEGLRMGAAATGAPSLLRLTGVEEDRSAEAALRLAELTAEAVDLARRLVDAPPGHIGPASMAATAADVAAREGLEVRIMEADELAAESMGGLLAIGRGSDDRPRLVELCHRPGGATHAVALVGKGITFDSGGLSLKSPDAMMDMKLDMAGAAAVLGAMSVVARLDLPVAVSAYLPLAENLPGPTAVRVGEVVTTRNGLTVEVRNTDFEGRVVLADALAYASERRPDLLVDLATLTDACTVALGDDIAGLLGNDDAALRTVEAAAVAAGEPLWRLPLAGRYADRLRSSVADLSNHPGNRTGRAITAALFLERFVGPEVPWAHLDVVGPSFRTGSGATGFGVRTLLQLLRQMGDPA